MKSYIYKYIKIITLILLLILSILNMSCSKNKKLLINKSLNINYEDSIIFSKEFKISSHNSSDNIKVNEYVLPVPENGELGDHTIYGDIIYYTVLYISNMSNFAYKIDIYSYDTNNDNVNLIYRYENNYTDIYLCELRANNKCLFWAITTPNEEWNYNKFDLTNNKIKTIRTSKDTDSILPIVVSLSNKYLSWYESYNKNGEMYFLLNVYFIEKDDIKSINDNVYLTSPFSRAHIRNDVISFLTKSSNSIDINIYNLNNATNTVLSIPTDKEVLNIMSNEKYTIWHEDYGKSNIYAYDHDLNYLYLINSENNYSIFNIDLFNNYIFINDSKSNNINCFDIKNKEKINLTVNLTNDRPHTLVMVASDNKLIARNSKNKCLIVELN